MGALGTYVVCCKLVVIMNTTIGANMHVDVMQAKPAYACACNVMNFGKLLGIGHKSSDKDWNNSSMNVLLTQNTEHMVIFELGYTRMVDSLYTPFNSFTLFEPLSFFSFNNHLD